MKRFVLVASISAVIGYVITLSEDLPSDVRVNAGPAQNKMPAQPSKSPVGIDPEHFVGPLREVGAQNVYVPAISLGELNDHEKFMRDLAGVKEAQDPPQSPHEIKFAIEVATQEPDPDRRLAERVRLHRMVIAQKFDQPMEESLLEELHKIAIERED